MTRTPVPQAVAAPETEKRVNVALPASTHRALKIRAATEGCSVQDLADRAIQEFLGRPS
ncbi:hypothetical protein GO986_17905 [Deinococcus sp. HMF7620]|uniref:Uncharacterized protein n=1 Tax=Deinococcus arboris TaxID=2682977 RepID=A0A7C9HTK3_9DEIO|nr:hypothetical protein [Deinococcus arboris]MVN88613.1 hypothetical protein [Deinococcus arboris]